MNQCRKNGVLRSLSQKGRRTFSKNKMHRDGKKSCDLINLKSRHRSAFPIKIRAGKRVKLILALFLFFFISSFVQIEKQLSLAFFLNLFKNKYRIHTFIYNIRRAVSLA